MSKIHKAKKINQSKGQNPRPTIGYMVHAEAPDILQAGIWGASDASEEKDANLICFIGNGIHESGFGAQGNILYRLSDAPIDGLLIHTSGMGMYASREEMEELAKQYRPMPCLSSAGPLKGFPCISVGRRQGMRDVVVHLIEVHDYQRIAFIRGLEAHSGAQERYQGYLEALAQHHIPLDANLVTPPAEYSHQAGAAMIAMLLDEHGLRPQIEFQAVVAASDEMAFGVVEVLRSRGIRMPDEVAVVGYNSSPEARVSTPPLTTVRPPYYEKARKAVEVVVDWVQGAGVPEGEILLPSSVAVRQSCGCFSPSVKQAAAGRVTKENQRLVGLFDRQSEILARIVAAVGEINEELVSGRLENLLNSFVAELNGGMSGSFLRELDEELRQVMAVSSDHVKGSGHGVVTWQTVVSVIRRYTLAYLLDDQDTLLRAEDLWQQARVLIGETSLRAQAYLTLQVEQQAQVVRDMRSTLIATFDIQGLMDVLAEGLPRLGISSCYLALYEDPKPYTYPHPAPEWSRLMLAYNEHGRIDVGSNGQSFRSHDLAPEEMLPQDRRYTLIVESLYFQDQQLGFVLFEMGLREKSVYEELRAGISSALQGALLVQRVQERSVEVAR